jgi:glutaminase
MKSNLNLFGLFFVLSLFIGFESGANSPARISSEKIRLDIQEVYQKFKPLREGKNADYIPALADVNSEYFGIAVVTSSGQVFTVGDSGVPFSIQSVSKPFVYALALKDRGEEELLSKVGVNATGFPFNSLVSIELKDDHFQNPLVNAGAIQTVSLVRGETSLKKWERIQQFLSGLAASNLTLSQSIFRSEMNSNDGNRSIAVRLKKYGMMYGDLEESLENYTKQCSLLVTVRDLAVMGATLANGGVNPISKVQHLDLRYVRHVLSVMSTAGLYEQSGKWWFQVGLPAKSGVGGGIVAVVPGDLAIAVFSPRLDAAGNSVRGQAVIRELTEKWKLHAFERAFALRSSALEIKGKF